MPRVSKYPVDPLLQEEMFDQFWRSLTKLKHVDEFASFFSDFLTKTEEMMLAKRFAVAILLLRGKKPIEIVPILHVSYSLTGSVFAWLKNAKPHTKNVLRRMMKEQEWRLFLDKVDGILDKAPLTYGRNWARLQKERAYKAKERSVREDLL